MKLNFFAVTLSILSISNAFCDNSSDVFEKFMVASDSIKEMSYGWRLDSPYRMSFIDGKGISIKDNRTNTAYLFNSAGAFRAKLPKLNSGETSNYDVSYPAIKADGQSEVQTQTLFDSNADKYREFNFNHSRATSDRAINFSDDKDQKYWREFERYLANELDLIEPSKTEMSKVDRDGLMDRLSDNFQAARALESPTINLAIERLIERAKEEGFVVSKASRASQPRRTH